MDPSRPPVKTLSIMLITLGLAGCSVEPSSSRAKKPAESQGSNDNNAKPTPAPPEVVPTPVPTPTAVPTRYPGLEVKSAAACSMPSKMERFGSRGTITETTTYDYKLDAEKRLIEVSEVASKATTSKSKRTRYEYSIVFPNLYSQIETTDNNNAPSSRSYRYDELGRLIEEIGLNTSLKRRTLTYDRTAQIVTEVSETSAGVLSKNVYDLKNKTSIQGESSPDPVYFSHFFMEPTTSIDSPFFTTGSLGTLKGTPRKWIDPVISLSTDRIETPSCEKIDTDYYCHWQYGSTKQHSQFRIQRNVDGPLVFHEAIPLALLQEEVETDGSVRKSKESIYIYDSDLRLTSSRSIFYPKGSAATESLRTYSYTANGCLQSEKLDGILQRTMTYPEVP